MTIVYLAKKSKYSCSVNGNSGGLGECLPMVTCVLKFPVIASEDIEGSL